MDGAIGFAHRRSEGEKQKKEAKERNANHGRPATFGGYMVDDPSAVADIDKRLPAALAPLNAMLVGTSSLVCLLRQPCPVVCSSNLA